MIQPIDVYNALRTQPLLDYVETAVDFSEDLKSIVVDGTVDCWEIARFLNEKAAMNSLAFGHLPPIGCNFIPVMPGHPKATGTCVCDLGCGHNATEYQFYRNAKNIKRPSLGEGLPIL